MIAFRVSHNGSEFCTAGIGDLGVITTSVTWVHNEDFRNDEKRGKETRTDLDMHVGGLHTPSNKHRSWICPEVQVGDVLQIEIIDANVATPHDNEYGMSKEAQTEHEKQYIRDKAKDFGWKIIEE